MSQYHEYLASREWALKREAVRKRSGGMCERCHSAPQQAVHHLTYERLYDELLDDLQAICTPCHEFVSGQRDDDPALNPAMSNEELAKAVTDLRVMVVQTTRELAELKDVLATLEREVKKRIAAKKAAAR